MSLFKMSNFYMGKAFQEGILDDNVIEKDSDQYISKLETEVDYALLENDNLTRRYAQFRSTLDEIADLVEQNSTQKKTTKTINGLTVTKSYESTEDIEFAYLKISACKNYFGPPTLFK